MVLGIFYLNFLSQEWRMLGKRLLLLSTLVLTSLQEGQGEELLDQPVLQGSRIYMPHGRKLWLYFFLISGTVGSLTSWPLSASDLLSAYEILSAFEKSSTCQLNPLGNFKCILCGTSQGSFLHWRLGCCHALKQLPHPNCNLELSFAAFHRE